VLEQIAEYISSTINDILHDPICKESTFRNYASAGGLSFSDFGGDGKGAQAQFFFSCEGTHLRLFINSIGYWWASKIISDNGMKSLIRLWPQIKQQINGGLEKGIKSHNESLSNKLSRQLELHDAIKNFQV
jgi:hypothetical protein